MRTEVNQTDFLWVAAKGCQRRRCLHRSGALGLQVGRRLGASIVDILRVSSLVRSLDLDLLFFGESLD